MKILIITTCYPPDTAIAAVRPYMFAKYLTQYGHDVTVLRSGILQRSADRSFAGHQGIRVITYLGENSLAERFERGESDFLDHKTQSGESRISFLPEKIRKPLAKAFHTLTAPYDFYQWLKVTYIDGRVVPMKKAIDAMAHESFDVVFSTYGAVENIFGGEYAAEVFGAKWFMDFRDPIEIHSPNAFGVPFLKRIQRNAVRKSDVCTAVSDGFAKHLSDQAGGKKVHTLYNGYDLEITENLQEAAVEEGLSLCYTGQMYGGRFDESAMFRDASPLFRALRELSDAGKIDPKKVSVHYAGPNAELLQKQAGKYGLEDIVKDHGYLGREDVARLQRSTDIYLVMSWNTRKLKGALPGKLYEGIRAGKPILSLVDGELPDSELYLINQKYNYGFCYESCREREQFTALRDWLENAYQHKASGKKIPNEANPGLVTDFRYDVLSRKMEKLCLDMLKEKS